MRAKAGFQFPPDPELEHGGGGLQAPVDEVFVPELSAAIWCSTSDGLHHPGGRSAEGELIIAQ